MVGVQGNEDAWVVGDALAQRHERVHLAADAAPGSVLVLEGDRAGDAAAQAQRGEEPSAGGELVEPGVRDAVGADGGFDAVVRRVGGVAQGAVSENHVHVVDAGGGQSAAGSGHDVLVHVDRGDVALLADEVAEDSGVEAGAGAQLQDLLAGLDVELFQHHGDDVGLGGAADGAPGSVELRVHGCVAVRLHQRGVREEEVAGNGPNGLLHPGRAHASRLDQMVDQLGAQTVSARGFDAGDARRPVGKAPGAEELLVDRDVLVGVREQVDSLNAEAILGEQVLPQLRCQDPHLRRQRRVVAEQDRLLPWRYFRGRTAAVQVGVQEREDQWGAGGAGRRAVPAASGAGR
ncbi:hypothetical protein EES47_14065 [Streptomyces sp. ADI98-12]|nr:hypothetical protein EES47_14065 [Streptomyces sp. ADI98-12]